MTGVLLVDDEPLVLIGMQGMLNWAALGYEVVGTARNGAEALRTVQEKQPDIVVSDIRMPVMDGLEATRRIRGMTREDARRIPIFALSANAFADDIQRSLQCGMNTHFNKPVDMDSICAALHYWLEHDKGNRP